MTWTRSSEPSPAPRRLRTCCAAWAIRSRCRYSPCTSSRWEFPHLCEWGRELISHSLSTLVLRPHTSCLQQPNIGGEVVPHQDSTFIYTKPLSCIGLWWALEDADRSNGCLWAAPEEHRKGLRRRFFVKDGECAVHHDYRSWPAPEEYLAPAFSSCDSGVVLRESLDAIPCRQGAVRPGSSRV